MLPRLFFVTPKATCPELHNYLSPPGHVDPGESDWVTALRETKEEAGLSEDDLEVSHKSCILSIILSNLNHIFYYRFTKMSQKY